MSKYAERADLLDLPEDLYQEIIEELFELMNDSSNSINHYRGSNAIKSNFSWRKVFLNLFLSGGIRTLKLSDNINDKIINHCHNFLNFTGPPDSIDFKIMPNFIFLPPHIDRETYVVAKSINDEDFQCKFEHQNSSLNFGILTNGERTNWYTYPGNFNSQSMNPFKLKKVKSICAKPREAYLYDNSSIHSVSRGKLFKKRCILSFFWNNKSYAELLNAYQLYQNSLD